MLSIPGEEVKEGRVSSFSRPFVKIGGCLDAKMCYICHFGKHAVKIHVM